MKFKLDINLHTLQNLCGSLDENLSLISKLTKSQIARSGDIFEISGENQDFTAKFIEYLASQDFIDKNRIQLIYQQKINNHEDLLTSSRVSFHLKSNSFKVRTRTQHLYLETISKHDLTFGVGVAGTGKTYLAVAAAVEAMYSARIDKIILVRPAVEAGEKLGFLPGDLSQKIDPYLRPLFDSLLDFMGSEKLAKLIERQQIEIAPLAYMRGRTLTNSFIILDEAQNTTSSQMKMFLTRIGFGSKTVVNGDLSQIDLPRGVKSGLQEALEILSGIEEISIVEFSESDVVRHPLVQKIIRAYKRPLNSETSITSIRDNSS